MQQNQELRKKLRKQRLTLSKMQQVQTEMQILRQLMKSQKFQFAQKIGIYLHAFGEVQTQKLIEYCLSHGKEVYLPMICNMDLTLVWVKISRQQFHNRRFSKHRLGMLEPMASRGHHVSVLDFLVLPLLACDVQGTRMGMGAGFYDRTLASAPYRPYRVGIAHDFQVLNEKLQRNAWDEPLDVLITPSKVYRFTRQ